MSGRVFFDTNVLVYAFDRSEPLRQQQASELLEQALLARTAVFSLQVLQEFHVVTTRKIRPPLAPAASRKILAELLRHNVIEPTGTHVLEAIDLSIGSQLSYWDALILTTAASAGCETLLTEDLSAGATVHGVRIVNPFR